LCFAARVDPIPFQPKNDFLGLGKIEQDTRVIESTVSQRRELDSERQLRESEGERKTRQESLITMFWLLCRAKTHDGKQDRTEKQSSLKAEISNTLKPFYCQLCDKQFKTVAQYDEHTNSYAHAHKARAKDQWVNIGMSSKWPNNNLLRKEKERKREEKELQKVARAAGVKLQTFQPKFEEVAKKTTLLAATDRRAEMSALPPQMFAGLSQGDSLPCGMPRSCLSLPPPPPEPLHDTFIPPPPPPPTPPLLSPGQLASI
jgi:hypothetical protein